ncbi:MAG: putative oxidoreductase [Alphaproteobacteria bacterium]|jgi:putative oxidoreductase
MNILLATASKIESNSGLSPLVLRITTATVFMAHGGQKLFSWFGGYGLEGTGQWMESIGLAPGYLMALLAGSAEFFGGLFLLFGLLTRASAFVLAITMIVAIFSVHFANGFFMSANGYEFAFALLGASAALMFSGAGKYSLDALILNKSIAKSKD